MDADDLQLFEPINVEDKVEAGKNPFQLNRVNR
jgi:hypothetical protein